LQQSILPAPLPTIRDLSQLPASSLDSAPALFPSLKSGLTIDIVASGIACYNVTVDTQAYQLIGGAFMQTRNIDIDTGKVTHSWACPGCTFGALSELWVQFDGRCAGFAVRAGTVSVHHSIDIVGFSAASTTLPEKHLQSVSVRLQPGLVVFRDTVQKVSERGITINPSEPTLVFSASPVETVVMELYLSSSSTYESIEILPIITISQLASSIIGLAGLMGAFGSIYARIENSKLSIPLGFVERTPSMKNPGGTGAVAGALPKETVTTHDPACVAQVIVHEPSNSEESDETSEASKSAPQKSDQA
jgi:hypothetical protein